MWVKRPAPWRIGCYSSIEEQVIAKAVMEQIV